MISVLRIWIAITLMTVILVGCVYPDGSSSTGTKQSGSPSKAVIRVCGQDISGEDLIRSPYMRRGLREVIYFASLEEEAKKQGVVVDPADIETQQELLLDNVILNNGTWDEFLKSKSLTQAEWEEQAYQGLLIVRLAEIRAGITEDDYLEAWDNDAENIVSQYMRRYHAPESERDRITYEDCYMVIKDMVFRNQAKPQFDLIQAELINNATLELIGAFSVDEANALEQLILGDIQTDEQLVLDSPDSSDNAVSARSGDSRVAESADATENDASSEDADTNDSEAKDNDSNGDAVEEQ